MCKKTLFVLTLIMCCAFMLTTTSCKWLKGKKADEAKPAAVKKDDSATKTTTPPANSESQTNTTHGAIEPTSEMLKRIHFDFDESKIRDDQKPVLDENASYLIAHPDVKILIEGHCDERGTIEYNLGLGDRRANSVKGYLAEKGVKNEIQILSKGEEQPLDPGHDENAWAKNRRAEFIIIK